MVKMNEHGAAVAALAPKWMGDVLVFCDTNEEAGTVQYALYYTIHGSDWCAVTPTQIDTWTNLRSDLDLELDRLNEIDESNRAKFVANILYPAVAIDIADLFLTVTTKETSGDPLLHYGHKTRFLPRDAVRQLMHTEPDYFYPRITEDSSFRQEDWYKEWEKARGNAE